MKGINYMEKIDVFAHVLLPNFYQKMLSIDPELPKKIPFLNMKSYKIWKKGKSTG